MSDHVVLDLDGLRIISNSLKQEKSKIEEIFNQDIIEILLNSSECLTEQGINYEEYCEEVGTLFDKFNNSFNDLTDVLSNKIIPRYENLSGDLTSLFNSDFASKMNSLLENDE